MTPQPPQPAAVPPARMVGAGIFIAIVVLILGVAMFSGHDRSDYTPAEQAFLSDQDSSLDDDDALRYGQASCELIETSSEDYTAKWLAGVDMMSQAGYVKPNPDPLSLYDARQIAAAAAANLC